MAELVAQGQKQKKKGSVTLDSIERSLDQAEKDLRRLQKALRRDRGDRARMAYQEREAESIKNYLEDPLIVSLRNVLRYPVQGDYRKRAENSLKRALFLHREAEAYLEEVRTPDMVPRKIIQM